MNLYFDSAYIAKCYINEEDSPAVRKLAYDNVLHSSELCIAEIACVLQRHVREGRLRSTHREELWKLFLSDLDAGVWSLFPLTRPSSIRACAEVFGLPPNVAIRAADAAHLFTAREQGFLDIWTNDRHMLRAAEYFSLQGRSVSDYLVSPK